MFSYNQGRCYTSVLKNPNGKGYVVMATNVEIGQSMEVSNPFDTMEAATVRAKQFAGYSEPVSVNYDHHDQMLSERLGF